MMWAHRESVKRLVLRPSKSQSPSSRARERYEPPYDNLMMLVKAFEGKSAHREQSSCRACAEHEAEAPEDEAEANEESETIKRVGCVDPSG